MNLLKRRSHGLVLFIICTFSLNLLFSNSLFAQAGNYYQNVDSSSATALRSDLHQLIDDHTRIPYTASSTDTWDVLEIADEDQDNSSRISSLYKNESYAKQGGGNNLYNREHSWPKSYGFPDDNSNNYPYTDMHHLFLADISYNSERSNKPFGNCNSSCEVFPTESNDGRGGSSNAFPGDSNWTEGQFSTGTWQPWSGRRGDVARALLYMDVRYEGGTHGITGSSEPNLILTNNVSLIESSRTGNNENIGYMGLLSVLLQWHQDDPVDAIEMQHHEAVASFQGNRNPFIDHPEWVACVYQNNCSGGGGNPGGGNQLQNGDSLTGLSRAQGQWRYYTIDLPSGASNLSVNISGGSGDADLYLRRGQQPTLSQYDCRPYRSGNSESCSGQTAGTYHIGIHAYAAYSQLQLNVSYDEASSSVIKLQQNNLSGNTGQWRNFPIQVDANANTLIVEMSGGSGDADLYVRRSSLPTTSTYDCRPYLNGNNETCRINNPQSGSWYISVRGFSAYQSLNITATQE